MKIKQEDEFLLHSNARNCYGQTKHYDAGDRR